MIGFKLETKTTPMRYQKLEFPTLKDTTGTSTTLPYKNPPRKDTHLVSISTGLFLLVLTLFIANFVGWYTTGGGGVFHLHPVTPLSLKLDDSNFVHAQLL